MDTDSFQTLKGHLLMAMPGMQDPNFMKSVTCISEHTAEGAVGIIINRIHKDLNAKMIFDELRIPCRSETERIPIYIGGPVHVNELFILHGEPFHWDGLLRINGDLALSNTKAVLEAIGRAEGPKDYIIALGCAGWGAGQLEWEMKQNAWLTTPCAMDILFQLPEVERWQRAMQKIGIDPDYLMDTAGNA
jgi:putative transcriptional regulator